MSTPDVIEGREFLKMDKAKAMHELGITSEQAYKRAYEAVEGAVSRNENRGGEASIVIKKAGKKVADA